jgi:hypothetical protein
VAGVKIESITIGAGSAVNISLINHRLLNANI